jgi:hypothetical protein
MKKLLSLLILSLILVPTLILPTYAAGEDDEPAADVESYSIPQPDYLPGIQSGLDPGSQTQDFFLSDTIPKVINVGTGILGIAAFLGIIFSAFTMLTAYGNEDKVSRGKTTLTYSLIGFVIVIFAYAIVSIIVSIALPKEDIDEEAFRIIPSAHAAGTNYEETVDILFPDQTSLIEDQDDQNRVSLPSGDLVTEIVPAIVVNLLYMVGFLVFVSFMYAGVLMVTGRGNDEMNTKAKNIIIWSGIALVLVSTAYAIIYGIATLNLEEDPSTENDDVFVETVVE